jgi:putative phosphoribosyl transferase
MSGGARRLHEGGSSRVVHHARVRAFSGRRGVPEFGMILSMRTPFRDRRDAGRRLAVELMTLVGQRPVVVALPRGGVPVAVEVARALGAPLDILAVRKLGAPGNLELGVGAVAEDGTGVLDPRSAGMVGMTAAVLEETLARESRELHRRVQRYRDGRPAIWVSGRTVIVVDDGLATGLSDRAAVRALRKRGAASIVVAAPVGPASRCRCSPRRPTASSVLPFLSACSAWACSTGTSQPWTTKKCSPYWRRRAGNLWWPGMPGEVQLAAGTCCVMQWILPPPSRISRAGTPTSSRSGKQRSSSSAASASQRLSRSGKTTREVPR